MYGERVDVRVGATPWILKIEHQDGEISALRYQDFNRALEFVSMLDEYFGNSIRICLMSQAEFTTQAFERNHAEWLDLIEDAEEQE